MDIYLVAFLLLNFSALLTLLNSTLSQNDTFTNDKIQEKFQMWKIRFSKDFLQNQERYRLQIFSQNLHKIHSHNLLPTNTYHLGLNQFAHLTQSEFQQFFLEKPQFHTINLRHQSIEISLINLHNLTDIDWQSLGKVSDVKNQGNCNAGYAFSITSLIQSSLLMENQNILLSEQQIIDCAGAYGTNGCDGGTRDGTLKYVFQKGLLTQKQYPYIGIKGKCNIQKGSFIPDITPVQSLGCQKLKQNLYKSPISVAVNAKNWQLYSNGVFNNCPTTSEVNHEIFLVGVTPSYWRLKNSWGSRWGQFGYIRIKLGNNCGICQRPGYGYLL